jgi:2-dehydro-3-deoxy-D-arabinonate dehydratase
MPVDAGDLPLKPCLVRVAHAGRDEVALWSSGQLKKIGVSMDELLRLTMAEMRAALDEAVGSLDLDMCELLAPVESQEVWACGVTYSRSREARMEESSSQDVYAKVYEAERPELFFKSAGWRVVGHGGEAGVRPDSTWSVPEPELAVLSNSRGELVAYACGNDMSSRSIEGENPLYLPQAKVYDRSCSIGPAAVPVWEAEPSDARIRMRISRGDRTVFDGSSNVSDMVRNPAELISVLHAAYPLPVGAWLLTGTSLVPPPPYTAEAGDLISIEIEGVGRLVNHVVTVPHSGARAQPRLKPDSI